MKLKDFLNEGFDVDVEGSLTDDWCIAFIGPLKLKKDARAKFAAILDNEVHFHGLARAEIEIDDEEQDELAKELFYAAAGFCSRSDFQKYFLM